MGQFLPLAVAGLPDDLLDHINRVGWFLPFIVVLFPASILLFFASPRVLFIVLVAAQIAGIYFGLRAVTTHLRRTGFTSFQIKIMLGPLYLVACFATNIVVLLVFGIIHKFF